MPAAVVFNGLQWFQMQLQCLGEFQLPTNGLSCLRKPFSGTNLLQGITQQNEHSFLFQQPLLRSDTNLEWSGGGFQQIQGPMRSDGPTTPETYVPS